MTGLVCIPYPFTWSLDRTSYAISGGCTPIKVELIYVVSQGVNVVGVKITSNRAHRSLETSLSCLHPTTEVTSCKRTCRDEILGLHRHSLLSSVTVDG